MSIMMTTSANAQLDGRLAPEAEAESESPPAHPKEIPEDSIAILEPKATFFPPLYEQRRAWILSILRREGVTSVIDIGCGEGSLLQCLSNPSSFLIRGGPTTVADTRGLDDNPNPSPNTPQPRPSPSPTTPTGSTTCFSSSSDPPPHPITPPPPPNQPEPPSLDFDLSFDRIPELHITHLAGLDVSAPELDACVSATAPRPSATDAHLPTGSSSEDFGFRLPRWEPLNVSIWRGSLDVLNEHFIDAECIVSSEVIEHLEPDVFPFFTATLLGVYRPRLLLVTTPNYTFNERFFAPGSTDLEGYPDPTGRTDRVFRHHDHKFEWTVDEFSDYCEREAARYGYSAEIAAIGRPLERDPWERDAVLGKATQVVLFRRQESVTREQEEARRLSLSDARQRRGEQHELVVSHTHTAHHRAKKPVSVVKIQNVVSKQMEEYYPESGWSIWELWTAEEISTSCGGYLDVLISSIISCTDFELMQIDGKPTTEWRVKFSGERHEELVKRRAAADRWDNHFQNTYSTRPTETTEESSQRRSGWPSSAAEANPWNSRVGVDWIRTNSWGSVVDTDRVDNNWASW